MRNLAGALIIHSGSMQVSGNLPKRFSDLQQTVNQRLAEHQIARNDEIARRVEHSKASSITGQGIDKYITAKEINLQQLVKELKELQRERDQLKMLNIKLVERAEKLQNLIDDQASAHQFYFDYPPKADPELE